MGYYRSSVELAQSTANRSTIAGKPVIMCYTTGNESDVCEELYDSGKEKQHTFHRAAWLVDTQGRPDKNALSRSTLDVSGSYIDHCFGINV